MAYMYLALAIVFEVIATSALGASKGLAQPIPLAIAVASYIIAFAFLGLTLRTMPVGVAYAIWSGMGIVLLAAYGWLGNGQRLDIPALVGLILILSGVLLIRLYSATAAA